MTIEELKELKKTVRAGFYVDDTDGDEEFFKVINQSDEIRILELIDEKISQLSVTDKRIQDAKKDMYEIARNILESMDDSETWEKLEHQYNSLDLAIQALQQMQKTQELEKENQGLKKTIEDMQRNLDAWNPRQSFNEPTTGNPMPQISYTTSSNKTDLADGKLR